MGVPGFFAWLLRKYQNSNIVSEKINDEIDTLYLDANCLYHPQCHKVLDHYNNTLSVDQLEDKMISRILQYVDFIINLVNPRKHTFIAVDGVAPLAKMNQQRKRRFRALKDNELRNSIKKKYGKETTTIWNNTVITPGTNFMEKLHMRMIAYINKSNRKIIYSSYHNCGEGEHKILQDIKSKPENDSYMIYGLDADLIFLALASNRKRMYLLREDHIFTNEVAKKEYDDITEKLNCVSISEVKNCINHHIKTLINIETNYDFSKDFTLICYFSGNDFIPNLPSIEIKNYGLDFLMDQYATTYLSLKTGLIQGDNINMNFFKMYISNISRSEDFYFRVKFPEFLDKNSKRICSSTNDYDIEIWNMENMKMFGQQPDPVKLGSDRSDLWKFRFYEHYYGVSGHQTEHIHEMCHNYMEGIIWTMKYYFQKCPSHTWQYKYYHAPFSSDLKEYLAHFDLTSIKFPEEVQITPYVQLLGVLPPSCYGILPTKYGSLMTNADSPIIDLYPVNIKLDMLYKDVYHKCTSLVPNIDIKRMIDATKAIELTDKEKINNVISNKLIVNYKQN